jgi:predicted ArsR family transcriptional regulator
MRSSRRDVLAALQSAGRPMEVGELSAIVGLHVNTVRFHLDRLLADELVERVPGAAHGLGRPPLQYRALASGRPVSSARNYEVLAQILVEHVLQTARNPALAAEEAGRSWGEGLATGAAGGPAPSEPAALDGLVGALAAIGFEPEVVPPDRRTVRLNHCPFREIARQHREVTCAIHLGLMRGLLEASAAPLQAHSLEPFVEPTLCLARLAPASPG